MTRLRTRCRLSAERTQRRSVERRVGVPRPHHGPPGAPDGGGRARCRPTAGDRLLRNLSPAPLGARSQRRTGRQDGGPDNVDAIVGAISVVGLVPMISTLLLGLLVITLGAGVLRHRNA
jgi:hypothetical protein